MKNHHPRGNWLAWGAAGIWGAVILGLVGLAAFWLILGRQLSGVTPTPAEVAPLAIAASPYPTVTLSPTRTPTPSPTAIPSPTQIATPLTVLLPHPSFFATAAANAIESPIAGAPIVIGYSVGGRPLEVYRFGSGARYRRMIVAGIHGGNEWNTIALADELIEYLGNHPSLVPSNTTLYILRALNPDGEARAQSVEGRVNDHGVDLNRNWPVNWRRNWPLGGCWSYQPVTPGWRPASEPETTALMQFVLNQRIDALLNYHSAALGIFPGGWPPDPASVRLAEAVAEVTEYPYPPKETGCLYSGTMVDWAAANGIAALDIELTDHFHTDFDINLNALSVFLKWRR